ncbi:hypothetical protein Vi05172_g6181 [Venturia inaequalis]|nr:hypothetical protein Vi05172_g6181 [Venturia inaequalis]
MLIKTLLALLISSTAVIASVLDPRQTPGFCVGVDCPGARYYLQPCCGSSAKADKLVRCPY